MTPASAAWETTVSLPPERSGMRSSSQRRAPAQSAAGDECAPPCRRTHRRTLINMTSSRLLVISSCTGDKAVKIPALTLDDFADPNRLAQREHELASVRRPAAAMYTGRQHVYLMRGIDKLRAAFGNDFVDLRILSAGYGLIEADRAICPYDVTFSDMGKPQARAWARRLGVPSDVRAALEDVEVAIFLLGSRYLDAVDPPIAARGRQRLVFLAKPSESSRLTGAGVVTIPAGKSEATRYGSGLVALKGKMFERFAEALAGRRVFFDEIKADDSPTTFVEALGS